MDPQPFRFLHRAVETGHTTLVIKLLDSDLDPNAPDLFEKTPLHLAEQDKGYNGNQKRYHQIVDKMYKSGGREIA